MKKTFTLLLLCLLIVSLNAQDLLVKWTFPTGTPNDSSANGGIAANGNSTIRAIGTSAINYTTKGYPDTLYSAQCINWNNGNGTKYWQVSFSSLGFHSLKLSSRQQSGGTKPGPKYFKVQYRMGILGDWTNVQGASDSTANNWTASYLNNVALPAACEDADTLFIRWIMTSNLSSDGTNNVASAGVSKIDEIYIYGNGLRISAANDTICSGASTTISPACEQTSQHGIRYNWTVTSNSGVIGYYSSSGRGQTLETPIEQTLINTSNEVQEVRYVITPWAVNAIDSNAIFFPSSEVRIMIEPKIILVAINDTIESGSSTAITPESQQSSFYGIRYTWTIAASEAVTGAAESTGNGLNLGSSIEQALSNSSNSIQSVMYTLYPWIISSSGENRCGYAPTDVELLIRPIANDIKNKEKASEVNAYFNTASNTLHVNSPEQVNQLRVFDLTGRTVFSIDHPVESSSIEIPGLRQGIYLVQIHAGKQTVVRRVMKQ